MLSRARKLKRAELLIWLNLPVQKTERRSTLKRMQERAYRHPAGLTLTDIRQKGVLHSLESRLRVADKSHICRPPATKCRTLLLSYTTLKKQQLWSFPKPASQTDPHLTGDFTGMAIAVAIGR